MNKELELYAYVIMPSHIHLLAGRTNGPMSDLIRDYKSHTAKAIIKFVGEDNRESRKEWLLHLFRFFAKYQKHLLAHACRVWFDKYRSSMNRMD